MPAKQRANRVLLEYTIPTANISYLGQDLYYKPSLFLYDERVERQLKKEGSQVRDLSSPRKNCLMSDFGFYQGR